VKLHTKILLGLATGATLGCVANLLAPKAAWLDAFNHYVTGPVGQVFLRLLLMTVIPLIFASITLGVANMGDVRNLGRIGGKTLLYFLVSTAIAVLIGVTLVNIVRPGDGLDPATRTEMLEAYRSQAQGLQAGGGGEFGVNTFVNIIPRNPIAAAANMDILGLIFVAIMLGACLTMIPQERAQLITRPLEVVIEVIGIVINIAMKLAPFGVFALVFSVTSRFGFQLLASLSAYVGVVIAGLAFYGFVVISIFVRSLGGLSPLVFWKKSRPAVLTGFSTSSGNATLPEVMSIAEKELKIPAHISGFVLPLGATMNSNGSALFEGMTVLFLAQVFGVHLTLGQQIIVVILSVVTSIGVAGIPSASMPLLMLILATIGVPPESVAIVLGVDRILDMCRTVVNVQGDLAATVIIARSEKVWQPRAALEEAA
jgi:dicarboxylate/amino acid:cation (Na+ or H+) symporter, DAACS family